MRASHLVALLGIGLLAACGQQAASPDAARQASPEDAPAAEPVMASASEQPPPASVATEAPAQRPLASGTPLRGTVSRLGADVSGLRGLVDQLGGEVRDEEIFVELPADTMFAFDEARILPASETALSTLATLIGETRGIVQLVGHTDDRGNNAYNQTLSEQRAQAVAEWLKTRGVAAERLQVSGRGASAPIADNRNSDGSDNPEGRARNRRVEAVIPTD